MRPMATRRVPALPPDGGASYVAGWSSAEVAVAALAVFVVFVIVGAIVAKSWPGDLAFLALVTGGLLVTWPVMILMSGAALVLAVVVGVAQRVVAPRRAAQVDAEADAMARNAQRRLGRAREPGS